MLTIEEIVQAVQGSCCQTGLARQVKSVVIDSRRATKGALFFAIQGPHHDGHCFLEEAVQRGAVAVVVTKDGPCPPGAWAIRVKDTTKSLGDLARYYRQQFKIPVVAITGSAGKTTTKEMIAAVLKQRFRVLKNPKTENNQYGVPMTLLQLRPKHQAAVIEIGTNHFGEIAYLTRIAEPTVSVLTSIGASHLEHLKSLAGVFREKFDIVRYMRPSGTVVFYADDPYLRKIQDRKITQDKIAYGRGVNADIRLIKKLEVRHGCVIFFVGKQRFILHTLATHNRENALAAIAVGRLLKVPAWKMAEALARWRPAPGRQRVMKVRDWTIVDDTYNANPISFQSALDTFSRMACRGRKILVCGDMKELGAGAIDWHRRIGRLAAISGLDIIISVGDLAQIMAQEAHKTNVGVQAMHAKTIEGVKILLSRVLGSKDVVLVKGSRAMSMDLVVDFLARH